MMNPNKVIARPQDPPRHDGGLPANFPEFVVVANTLVNLESALRFAAVKAI